MYGGGFIPRRIIQKLERATPYGKRRRRKRARTAQPEHPAGPKLVRGRGLRRRRRLNPMRWVEVTVYFLIACAILVYLLPKLPFMP